MGRTAVRVRLVGPFAVIRDGEVLPVTDVGSRKARTLLAVLALAGGRIVAADRIVAALWPDEPPRKPAENVATLISRIRAALGAGVVDGNRAGYRLGDGVSRRPRRGRPAGWGRPRAAWPTEPALALAGRARRHRHARRRARC